MEKQDLAKQQLEKLDSILDEYECSLGISMFSDQPDEESAKKYLRLSREHITVKWLASTGPLRF